AEILRSENVRVSKVRQGVKAILDFCRNRIEARRRDEITGERNTAAHRVLDSSRRQQSRKISATPGCKRHSCIPHRDVRGTEPLEFQAGEEECLIAAVVNLRNVNG